MDFFYYLASSMPIVFQPTKPGFIEKLRGVKVERKEWKPQFL